MSVNLMKLKEKIKEMTSSVSPNVTLITNLDGNSITKRKLQPNKSCGDLNYSTIKFYESGTSNRKMRKGSIIGLKKMIRNASIDSDNFCTIKHLNEVIDLSNDQSRFDENIINSFKAVKELQNSINDLKLKLERLKSKELKRINKEFLSNNYQRRYNITQEEVISAIVGEDNTIKEYAKFVKDQKED